MPAVSPIFEPTFGSGRRYLNFAGVRERGAELEPIIEAGAALAGKAGPAGMAAAAGAMAAVQVAKNLPDVPLGAGEELRSLHPSTK